MNKADFLNQVIDFGNNGKDLINEETIELMTCYIDLENFTSAVAKNASKAAEGLCTWVSYYFSLVEFCECFITN